MTLVNIYSNKVDIWDFTINDTFSYLGKAEKRSGSLYMENTGGYFRSGFYSKEKVDLSRINSISVSLKATGLGGSSGSRKAFRLCITDNPFDNTYIKFVDTISNSSVPYEFSLDVSEYGDSFYVCLILINDSKATGTATIEVDMVYTDTNYLNKVLIQSSDGDYLSVLRKGFDGNVVPVMTSDTAPLGVTSSNSSRTGDNPYKAFDNNSSSMWVSSLVKDVWLQYQFSSPQRIVKYGIYPNTTLSQSPKNFRLQASNDGVDFVTLDTRIDVVFTSVNMLYFEFDNNVEYEYYRLYIDSNGGNSVTSIATLEMHSSKMSYLKHAVTPTEQNFISHGMDKPLELDMTTEISTRSFIEQSPAVLGSGKVFKKSIDTSKLPIKGVTIEY